MISIMQSINSQTLIVYVDLVAEKLAKEKKQTEREVTSKGTRTDI